LILLNLPQRDQPVLGKDDVSTSDSIDDVMPKVFTSICCGQQPAFGLGYLRNDVRQEHHPWKLLGHRRPGGMRDR
jgi:hypothetical protein